MAHTIVNRVVCGFTSSVIALVLAGCDRVSISYQDHQPAHHHVWVKTHCQDCDARCDFCSGCGRYHHRTVRVRVERHAHEHRWSAKWCKRCRVEYRVCSECETTSHEHARKTRVRKGKRRIDR